MLVVGDNHYGYIFQLTDRTRKVRLGEVPVWEELRKLTLHKATEAFPSCYFTTAWSQNGRFCATASEDGYVSVFEATLFDKDEDPLIALMPSTRPDKPVGAVRAMCFVPEPYSLLVWTENHGRVCFAHLRPDLSDSARSSQPVILDPSYPYLEKIKVEDASSVIDEEAAQQTAPREETPTESSAASRQAVDDRFRASRQRQEAITLDERTILEALRSTREREATLTRQTSNESSSTVLPRSINYSSPYQTPSGNQSSRERAISSAQASRRIRSTQPSDIAPTPASPSSQPAPPSRRSQDVEDALSVIGNLLSYNSDARHSSDLEENVRTTLAPPRLAITA